MCEIEIDLGEVFKARAYYDEISNGKSQLKFDPPVYQQRYSTVLNILKNPKWSHQMKKVCYLWSIGLADVLDNNKTKQNDRLVIPHFQIVEYGCAEMSLAVYLRRLSSVEHLLQVIE